MYCLECGTKNSADSKFCKECGVTVATGQPRSLSLNADIAPVGDPVTKERLVNLIEMAFWHNDAGNIDPAIMACEAALAINPSSSTAHSLLGTLYEKKGELDRAVEHLEAVVNLNPDSTADVAKLEQLRNGVRTKTFELPTGYRWVPPALASYAGLAALRSKVAEWKLEERRVGSVKLVPALSALAAVAAVAAIGTQVLKPQRPALANTTSPSITPTSVANSAFSDPNAQLPAPATLTPPSNAGRNTAWPSFKSTTVPTANFKQGPDPFGEKLTSTAGTRPVWTDANSSPLKLTAGRKSSSNQLSLPPLTLKAVPPTGQTGTLAPAPVSIVPGNASVSQGELKQHVVAVTSLNGGGGYPQVASNDTGNSDNSSGDGGVQPVIRVAVHNGDSSGVAVSQGSGGTSSGDSGAPASNVTLDRAASWQQSALAQQQDGNYRTAASSYQQAIKAFKSQISSGQNVDAARRGLKACQTGLEICQQSVAQ